MTRPIIASLLAFVLLPALCFGQERPFDTLLERVPNEANAIMFVDVAGLLDSPMGKREGWREAAAKNRPDPLGMLSSLTKVVVAENLDVTTMHEHWRLGLFQAKAATAKIEDMAAREGGYVEDVNNMPVAFTPRGITLFRFTDNMLGFVASADRQAVVRWMETSFLRPRKYAPAFADQGMNKANFGYQIVLTANLQHAISPKALEPWLNTLPDVKKTFSEPKLIAPRFASAKSIYVAIKVDQSIHGEAKIEFERTLEGTAPILRTVVTQTAEDLGIDFPELKTWLIGLSSDNRSISMEGRLSIETARRLLSLASIPQLSSGPRPPSTEKPKVAEKAAAKPDASKYSMAGADPVSASQAYFRSVTGIVASLKSTNRPTYRATKTWYDRYAKQLDELPILNVDKELLDWGGKVSRTLREMSTGINYYSQNQTYTLASQPGGVYVGYNGYYAASDRGYDQAVIKRQSDAMMSVDLDKNWQAVEISIADMRRKMVEKYNVDF